jgi:glycosyltransferase involved in cell wall biosynthesis
MKVFYWSPFISEVATTFAVINSIKAIKKFSKNKKINCKVIDVFKEWSSYQEILDHNNIETIKLKTSLNIKRLPVKGFLKSRFTYILVFFFSIIKLHKIIKKEKPDYLIIHLISYIPLILLNLFNYQTKFILRISGFPKTNLIRKFFWKISNKKLDKIFCPTLNTREILINENIFSKNKLFIVNDPVIDVNKVLNKRNKNLESNYNWLKNKKFIISVGRLSKQKNFLFLINNFKKILDRNPDLYLIILGEGEDRHILEKEILKKNMENNIFLLGYQNNIYPFIKNSLFFVLTSDWEDPGFVILESMFSRKVVLSSNCISGPKEIIKDGINGFLYKKNDKDDFCKKFFLILDLINNKNDLKKITLQGIIKSKDYSKFNHFKQIKNLLN